MSKQRERFLGDLRKLYKKSIFIWCETEDDFWDLLEDAEEENYKAGGRKPTWIRHGNRVVRLGDYSLGHVGLFSGGMIFSSDSSDVIRIDYGRYRSGEENYIVTHEEIKDREERQQNIRKEYGLKTDEYMGLKDREKYVSFWRIPWVIKRLRKYAPERELGYTCVLRREDDPGFYRLFQVRRELVNEVERIEREEWNSYRKHLSNEGGSSDTSWIIDFLPKSNSEPYRCKLTRSCWPGWELRFVSTNDMAAWIDETEKVIENNR